MQLINGVAFTVPGKPQGKGRARSTKTGHHYTPRRTVAYESLISLAAANAMGPARPFSGPVAVEIDAIHAVPASWSKKRRTVAHWADVTPDGDNVAKSVGDAGNGIVWEDDRQIVSLLVRKLYGDRPEVRVRVACLGEEK